MPRSSAFRLPANVHRSSHAPYLAGDVVDGARYEAHEQQKSVSFQLRATPAENDSVVVTGVGVVGVDEMFDRADRCHRIAIDLPQNCHTSLSTESDARVAPR